MKKLILTDLKPFVVLVTFTFSLSALASDFYWINGSGSWNDIAHWSNSSGGTCADQLPGASDNVTFDHNSFPNKSYPFVDLTTNVAVNSLTFASTAQVIITGTNHSFTLYGVLETVGTFFLNVDKLIFKNSSSIPSKINANNNDINADIVFDSGKWELGSSLKTTIGHTIEFINGELVSNSYTIYAQDIIAKDKEYAFDLTNSIVYGVNSINFSASVDIGSTAYFHTEEIAVSAFDKGGFGSSSSTFTRDQTTLCSNGNLVIDIVTLDFNGGWNVSCNGSCDGEMTISASGTPGPYAFSFNTSSFTSQTFFDNLCADNYLITVRDSSNELVPGSGIFYQCTVSEQITTPTILQLDLLASLSISCPGVCDGSAFTSPQGGTFPHTVNWLGSGETTTNPVALCSGVNVVTLADANGCFTDTSFIIAAPPDIMATLSITEPTCEGDCDAEVSVTPAMGNGGPYTFNWNVIPTSGQGTNPGIGFCAGPVTLSIFDVLGCQVDTIFTITEPPELNITAAKVADALCFGDCNGQASSNITGGVAPYTFEWFTCADVTTGITDQNPSTLCAGSYYVLGTDNSGAGCTDNSLCFTITEPPELTVNAPVISHISCFGDCDGSAQVVIGGGTPNYTISWVPGGQTTPIASNLCEGNYTVTVTDLNGCANNDNVVINEPAQLTLAILGTDPSCYDLCDGSAVATLGGGNPGYTLVWTPTPPLGQGTPNPSTMCAGLYTLDVTDNQGCTIQDQVTLTVPPIYDITSNQTDLQCAGDSDGTIDLIINNGGSGAGYTFTWLPAPPIGAGTPSVSGLTAGAWCVTISDNMFCDTTICFTITEPPELTVNAPVISHISCFGDCDGSAQVVIGGGTPNYTISWVPGGQTTPIASNLCEGNYTVTVTDLNGCANNDNVVINEPAQLTLAILGTDPSCYDLCDGSAVATLGGGNPGYTLVWTPTPPLGQGTPNPSTMCAGLYTLDVTDNQGCTIQDQVTLTVPPIYDITSNQTDLQCAGDSDGTIDLIINNGGSGAGYTFTWLPAPPIGAGTPSVSGLTAGAWCVTISDNMFCDTTICFTITEPPELTVNAPVISHISCFGDCDGSAQVIIGGGTPNYTISWVPGGQTTPIASNLCEGNYTVTVTDLNGCANNDNVVINEPAQLTLAILGTDPSCYDLCDGSAVATLGGGNPGYTLVWTPTPPLGQGTPNPSTMCAGLYTLDVTDNQGCTIQDQVTLTVPPIYDITSNQTDLQCAGDSDGTIDLIINNGGSGAGYTFTWLPAPPIGAGTPSVSGLTAGAWCVTISDNMFCDTTICFTITEPPELTVNAPVISHISCFGDCDGQIDLSPSGGTLPYTVSWSDFQFGNTAFALCSGMITATITDAMGCVKDTIIGVTEPPELTATLTLNNSACGICEGSATVNAIGGAPSYTYFWTPTPGSGQGTNNATNLCPGIYTADVTDQNGCVFTEVFAMSNIQAEALTMDSTDISCFGVCDGGAEVIYICGDPACTNQWYDGLTGSPLPGETGPSVSNLCAGDYLVEVTNASGCVSIGQTTIIGPTQIIANEIITQITCNGSADGAISIGPTGGSGIGYTYTWTPIPPNGQGTNQALNLGSGNWCVDIEDGDGCVESICYILLDPGPIVINPTVTDPLCNGDCNGLVIVTVSGGGGSYTYQWLDGAGTPIPGEIKPLITGLCPGNYTIEVTDATGCTQSQLITLAEPVAITSPIIQTNVSCFGNCDGTATATPIGGFSPYIINWYNSTTGALIGQSGTNASNLCPEDYHAVITDNNGCSFTTTSIPITEPLQLTWVINSNDASCFGVCDGGADMVPSEGTLPYAYEWADISGNPVVGGTNPMVMNLCAGNYTVEVMDANGCTSGQQLVVINQFPQITANVFTNEATCGIPDGNATVFPQGGNSPFLYQWLDNLLIPLIGETNNTLLNAIAGTYFVEVTDANGCTETFQANIGNPPSTTLVWDAVNHPSCFGVNDGSLTIKTTTTNPPLMYTWNPGGIISKDPAGLVAGLWTLKATDAVGCINFFDTTLVDPAEIIVSATVTPSNCEECNGAIDLTTAGSIGTVNVVWNNLMTGINITGLCPGLYEAQITDQSGCLVVEQVSVPNTAGFTVDKTIAAISCAGSCDGQATLSGIGGTPPYSYLWLHDNSVSDTQTGLCAGSYFVSVMDATGCNYTAEVVVLDPPAIQTVETIVNPACGVTDGSITVISSGGILPHTYLWNTLNVTPAIANLGAGLFTLTITDNSGCSEDFVYDLSNSAAPIFSLTSIDISCNSICDGQIDTVSVVGGTPVYSYQWMDGTGTPIVGETNPLLTGLCIGDYILEITDASGCISYESENITQPDPIFLNPLFIVNPLCADVCDGKLIANPFGGTPPFTFLWDDAAAQNTLQADNLCDGTYNLVISDDNGCVTNQTGTLTEPSGMVVLMDNVIDASCMNSTDGEIYITISGGTPGYTTEWISETLLDTLYIEDPTGLLPMDYYLTVTDINGCTYTDTIPVDTVLVVLVNASSDTVICSGFGFEISSTSNVDPAGDYTWYDITMTTVIGDTNTFVSAGNPSGTEYYIVEMFFGGCTNTDTVMVTTATSFIVDAGPDVEIFATQTEVIGGSPTSTDPSHVYNWSPSIYLEGTTIANPSIIEPQTPGWYYVTVTDTNGCIAVDSMELLLKPGIVIPDGISPDGNGLNDTWILDFIDLFPGVGISINVYNRWGEPLFMTDETYQDDWDGTTKSGLMLPAGTYYYTIEIDHPHFPDPITGPITIMW